MLHSLQPGDAMEGERKRHQQGVEAVERAVLVPVCGAHPHARLIGACLFRRGGGDSAHLLYSETY